MFCLDYALAFFVHAKTVSLYLSLTKTDSGGPDNEDKASRQAKSLLQTAPLHFASGAFAGGVTAVALYPFDVVRQIATSSGPSVRPSWNSFGYGTIPFMALYIGVYFTAIDTAKAKQQELLLYQKVGVAGVSSALAAAAEFPLDKAKQELMGRNMRLAFATSVLRVPLSALLLIAYDHILGSISTTDIT